jgi:hypothetical protein
MARPIFFVICLSTLARLKLKAINLLRKSEVTMVTEPRRPLDAYGKYETLSTMSNADTTLLHESLLYREFLAEREEIMRHKWIESQKAGHDIGFEKALLDWIVNHRRGWREWRRQIAYREGVPML